eukprot:TRINITY_DN5542_c0_g1_i1.p1 TRINITY_DN5542_c0_g1~~TRINITY_DN5542_c0_g1_i1.p1  ORF type:complete len:597 (-),score=100.43 TRINITY_DN5542_c0_g1_i1:181-1971(-)
MVASPNVSLDREVCFLSLDYAWYHTATNLIVVIVFILAKRHLALRAAHAFGIFAMAMDYGVMYLYRSTRTVDWAVEGSTGPFPYVELSPYPVNITDVLQPPMPPMTPSGTLLFFLWFDYLGAAGMILWAFAVCEDVFHAHKRDRADWFILVFLPVVFWSAPVVSPLLQLDGRVLEVSRPSPKATYVVMLLAGFALLHFVARRPLTQVAQTYLAGFGCGLIHHLALFVHGMRGHNSLPKIAITLCTEWPALIVGVVLCTDACRRLPRPSSRMRLAAAALVAALALAAANFGGSVDADAIIADMLPFIPGEWMHNFGTTYFRARTCELLPSTTGASRRLAPLPATCGLGDAVPAPVLVLAATAKGGAMLAAKLLLEVGLHCGLCISGGTRRGPGIPGESEAPPTFEGDALLAVVNMRGWPEHVRSLGRPARCAVFARDPGERLRSLYLYARSGGEYWARAAGLTRRLAASNDTNATEASLAHFWDIMGRGYLVQSHAYIMMSKREGCTIIRYGDFKMKFNATVLSLLSAFGIQGAEAREAIVARAQKLDFGRKSRQELERDPHHSASKFSPELVSAVELWTRTSPAVRELVKRQRDEL